MQRLISILLLLILSLVLLYYSPIIDQRVSLLPFDTVVNKFYGESCAWCRLIYLLVPFLTGIMIAIPVILLVFYKKISNHYKRATIIVLLALALGPGLIVNTILKNHWGRARPYQVLRDNQTFSPVWQRHANAPENNSFCSGHASIGFFLGIPFLALRRKKLAVIVSIAGGSVIGIVRILQGGHYVTDVVFAGILVWLSAFLAIYLTDNLLRYKQKKLA